MFVLGTVPTNLQVGRKTEEEKKQRVFCHVSPGFRQGCVSKARLLRVTVTLFTDVVGDNDELQIASIFFSVGRGAHTSYEFGASELVPLLRRKQVFFEESTVPGWSKRWSFVIRGCTHNRGRYLVLSSHS